MNLFDTISQASLNDLIDDLLNNFHKEFGLDLDDPVNDYCGLSFDTSDGLDAGSEVIFNEGDELRIGFNNQRLALLGYSLRFYYYRLDKGDLDGSKAYGELQSFVVDLDSDLVSVPFTDDQVYLQKDVDLILLSNTGSRLSLSANKTTLMPDEDLVLSATFVSSGEPVPDKTVSFFDGETLIGTGITNSSGVANLTISEWTNLSHSFIAICDGIYSKNVLVDIVVSEYVMEFTFTGTTFDNGNSNPFTYNGKVFIDWGDESRLVEYTGGRLQHEYSTNSTYEIKIYGNITNLHTWCFRMSTGWTKLTIPRSVNYIRANFIKDGQDLVSIKCNWLTSSEIPIMSGDRWIDCIPSTTIFHIPPNTTTAYWSRGFPGDRLVEDTV